MITSDQLLKEYYNTELKKSVKRDFEDLTQSEKLQLKDTIGFAAYQLRYNGTELLKHFTDSIKKLIKKLGL